MLSPNRPTFTLISAVLCQILAPSWGAVYKQLADLTSRCDHYSKIAADYGEPKQLLSPGLFAKEIARKLTFSTVISSSLQGPLHCCSNVCESRVAIGICLSTPSHNCISRRPDCGLQLPWERIPPCWYDIHSADLIYTTLLSIVRLWYSFTRFRSCIGDVPVGCYLSLHICSLSASTVTLWALHDTLWFACSR